MRQKSMMDRLPAVCAALLVCSAAANFTLAMQLKKAGQLLARQNPQPLKPGAPAPPIEARDLQNQRRRIEFSAPTLLYVFTPACGWCGKNLDNVKALASHGTRIVGLSLAAAGLEDYVKGNGIDFPVFTDPDAAALRAYQLGATPTAILISEGRVLENWVGAWDGRTQAQIEARFHVRLPGLRSAP
jgi:hypothetical protein